MANALADGFLKRSEGPGRHTKAAARDTRPLSPPISWSEGGDIDAPGVERVRRGHSNFYHDYSHRSRKGAMRGMHSQGSLPDDPKADPARSSARLDRPRSRHRSSHHHKDRRRKEEKDDHRVVYVYKESKADLENGSTTSLRSIRRTREGRTTSTFIPDRLRVLRTLGLEPRVRSEGSQKPVVSPQPGSGRRHKYHGEDEIRKEKAVERVDNNSAVISSSFRPRTTRTIVVRDASGRPVRRPVVGRPQTLARRVRRASSTASVAPSLRTSKTAINPTSKSLARSSSVFGTIFNPPKPVGPGQQIECLTCLSDDIPISKSAKLVCGHRMCHSCLRRIFTMSVTDPAHMPPKCCTSDHIPLKHVEKLFDTKFKMKWNKKYQEYTTKNRVYCPARGCGEWIKPANIHVDTSGGLHGGRKYGKCARCKTKVCATCNGKWHTSRECPKDEATQRFAEIAKKEGWQRCFNCSATVELKEGCNHMTCRCRAEFCMVCGLKWKTCDCPWFNYQAVENDRLNHMNVPQVRREAVRGVDGGPRAYHEELARRREQERRDEALARRMQSLDLEGGERGGVFAVGNAAGHLLNERFVRRAADILVDGVNQYLVEHGPGRPAELNINLPTRARQAAAADLATPARPQITRRTTGAGRRSVRVSAERVVPRRTATDYASEAARHRPQAAQPVEARLNGANATRRHSAMAGLTRNTTEGRVGEWVRHVEEERDGFVEERDFL